MRGEQVRTVCPYCGVGCGMVLHVENKRVIKITGDAAHPANFGKLCTKGLTAHQALHAPGRLDRALLRDNRRQARTAVPFDTAVRETARRLRAIIDEHGPDAVSFYVSGQMSIEAQYLVTKLAKGFVGTNNIESNSRLCMASAASGYKTSLGADAPPGSYDDIDHTHLFFIAGANMADCHPILFLRVLERMKAAGAKMIVVDPRRTATAEKADLHLALRPGTDLALLNGLLHLLVANGAVDRPFIEAHTRGWDGMPSFLENYAPARVAAVTGLSEAQIRLAADWIAQAPEWLSMWTMGLNQSTQGTFHTNALCNLHLATGAICRRGSGPFSLTGQPNAMGGREMGYMGGGLPGQRSVALTEDRAAIEALWGIAPGTIRTMEGAGTVQGTVDLFARMAAGSIKACWIICTNPVASVPNREQVIAGLRAAQFVAVQDAYAETETTCYADVLLPGALWAEAEGVMTNSERNMTLLHEAVPPPGDAHADWWIISRVAAEMGYGSAFDYANAAEVFDEIRKTSNPATGYDLAGVTHARLREASVQWPCAEGDSPRRNPVRYLDKVFPTEDGRAVFHAREHRMPLEMPTGSADDPYPFVLNTGRLQHQWHTMTKTGRVATLNKLNPAPYIALHPRDAAALGIDEGDRVAVRSRRQQAVLPAHIADSVHPGNCFAPMHWSDMQGDALSINSVTSDAVDAISLQPALKYCGVALTRLSASLRALPSPSTEGDVAERAFAAAVAVNAVGPRPKVVLCWASQTGNVESLTERYANLLAAAGCDVRLVSMDAIDPETLARVPYALLLTSTFGDGDAPDNGQAFWHRLAADTMPRLDALRYAVLALGDNNFDVFCGHGRRLDARLEALGGTPLVPRVDCDVDFTEAADAWIAGAVDAIHAFAGTSQPATAGATITTETPPGPAAPPPLASLSAVPSRRQPAMAALIESRRLNGGGATKDTRFIALSLTGTNIAYGVGDALAVWPTNCPELVDELLRVARVDPQATVDVPQRGAMSVYQALLHHVEITRPSVTLVDELKGVLVGMAAEALAEAPAFAVLNGLETSPDPAVLKQWLWGKQVADVLQACLPPTGPALDAAALVALLKPLQPRLYSIASSPLAHPGEIHLTVSAVRYASTFAEAATRKGAASTYLADRCNGLTVPVYVQKTHHFRPPAAPDQAMIMVGPGTGVAPFRAFLFERRARGDSGPNWLFFGEQHEASDFYYRDEFTAMLADGTLSRLDVAFSRDQADKVYVQDKMREHGALLWQWLAAGASFFVCGDASRMAKDVDRALREVVARHGAMDAVEAAAYVERLARDKRYVRDVY